MKHIYMAAALFSFFLFVSIMIIGDLMREPSPGYTFTDKQPTGYYKPDPNSNWKVIK